MRQIISTCRKSDITLDDLAEYYRDFYPVHNSAARLAGHRSSRRRKEIAIHAVNTRWQRQRDFLEGSRYDKEAKVEETKKRIDNDEFLKDMFGSEEKESGDDKHPVFPL